jgi:hypothetical protein
MPNPESDNTQQRVRPPSPLLRHVAPANCTAQGLTASHTLIDLVYPNFPAGVPMSVLRNPNFVAFATLISVMVAWYFAMLYCVITN